MAEEPVAPSELLLRYRRFDNEGRLQTAPKRITGIPPECTVGELQQLVRESLNISPRQPVELLHWGRLLEPTLLLKNCSLSTHSELEVIARPRLQASAFTQGEPVKRVRLVSTKLQDGFTIDELSEEATVLDLKKLVQAHFAKNVTYFAQNKSAGDERSGTMAVDACDQLVSLGSAGAKKGVLKVQKVCDEEEGLVLETDVAQLQLGLESFNIIFEGRVLPEESTLEACGLINNERLVLDFRWPWDAGDDGKDSSGKGKGDKKAPAKKKK